MDWLKEKKTYVLKERKYNCESLCKKRLEIKDLNIIEVGAHNNIIICDDCLKKARKLTLEDIEYY